MRFLLCLTAAALITACGSAPVAVDSSPGASAQLDLSPVAASHKSSTLPADWQRDATFMQIYIRGYQDSDGDGIGDFNGLTSRLDYLQQLGVKGIWLMPMMASQDRDHGYAVTDYRRVEPDYGSLADFKTLLDEAHKRGIGIVIDYVMNHSAFANPLFLDALEQRAGKRDWYLFSEQEQYWPNWGSENAWRTLGQQHYYAVFWDQMPDFNLRNGDVLEFHQNNLRYWLNLGVDGFRFDAVGTLVENGRNDMFNQPENARIMQQMRAVLAEYDNRYLVCEMPDNALMAGGDDFCGSAFHFPMRAAILGSARFGRVKEQLVSGYDAEQTQQMAMFLANHDGFAGDRVMVQLGGNEARYKVAAATYLLSAGIPFIYYGEEIGMGHAKGHGVQYKDHALRAPMSWESDSEHGGFSRGLPFRALASNVASHNVAQQLADPASLLASYRQLIALRNAEITLRRGSQHSLESGHGAIYAFSRQHGQEQILVAINFGDQPAEAHLPQLAQGQWQPLAESSAAASRIMLQPFSYQLWKKR